MAKKESREQTRKRTEAERLKNLLAKKLTQMVQLNRTRTDLLEKFKILIDEYNKGLDVDAFFTKLFAFATELNAEDKRGMAEQLNDEELAIFDILLKPAIEISAAERKQVKQIARKLLQTLKETKLVLDWRKKLRTRADVYSTVKHSLDELPRAFTPELYDAKCVAVYQHVYDNYWGEGSGIYGAA